MTRIGANYAVTYVLGGGRTGVRRTANVCLLCRWERSKCGSDYEFRLHVSHYLQALHDYESSVNPDSVEYEFTGYEENED